MTLLLNLLLPLCFILQDSSQLLLRQDLQKDFGKLQQNSSHFISDNSTLNPSVETVANDLQLFGLVANLDLSQATSTWQEYGSHQVRRWKFDEGNIRSITQIQSEMKLDTLVTQRYLDNKAPTQQHITNSFTFRTYLISTDSDKNKLYYQTENEQGLLSYQLGDKVVEITYASPKKGLADVLQPYRQEIEKLTSDL
ncbi:hypothetical protein POKO110462_21065 [Pontibacter korlensis]|uniref:Uncharacterized protein n=1 Tax=Pontibacter korlensis TaxID=400092 RepID=A0A0E3ZDY6_9BACT|nr:hypothetical protein [Pontibacter korlensis]AKD01980.1 hypothetical protein PKOR_01005 [Pontibacter korlensis]